MENQHVSVYGYKEKYPCDLKAKKRWKAYGDPSANAREEIIKK